MPERKRIVHARDRASEPAGEDLIRIWCDFNAGLSDGTYSLSTVGSEQSLSQIPNGPTAGMRFIAFTEDVEDDGQPALLLADGVLETDPTGRWVARIDEETFRHEPMTDE